MAYYLVRARPLWPKLPELHSRLDAGEIMKMQPFGRALDKGLRLARLEGEDIAIWEEEDYCSPPLAQERAAVLDRYFTDLSVERVESDQGWVRISHLPSMWERKEPRGS